MKKKVARLLSTVLISTMLSGFFPIIGAAAILGNTPALNVFLYGTSVYACLSSNILTLLVCVVISCLWAVVYNALGTLVLSRSDVY